ncbi:Protein ABIL3 [Striga hermonthica]|uniref:Protein ABIL3 n=1 Tax=Striga hermonthica TaxID=68872 RepID=A0A9N7N777_STRHE|nr:Protein ABIL3 [Striga hermonthica]
MSSKGKMPFPREPANYDEVSMQQSMLFSDSLKDLKNLRKQLYSAAEYFELSYSNDDQNHVMVNTLKDYAIKALVNTVDHLGSVTYKVNDMLDEKVDEVSITEFRVSCIQQRLRTCQEYVDREGLSQQLLVINTPLYHKRYILPIGETMHGAVRTKSRYRGCSLDDGDQWHQFKNSIRATIRETPPPSIVGKGPLPFPRFAKNGNFSFSNKDSEKRATSPNRVPIVRSVSHSTKLTTPKSSNSSTQNASFGRESHVSESRKSVSMRFRVGKESSRENEQYPNKSKHLLKSLLSRRKSKKDDTLYTYLDEY